MPVKSRLKVDNREVAKEMKDSISIILSIIIIFTRIPPSAIKI